MADARLAAILDSLKGRMGDFVLKNRGGRTYLSRRPDFGGRVLSSAQEESLRRFRTAVAKARVILSDPEARRKYEEEAKRKGRTAYNLIISEYLNRLT